MNNRIAETRIKNIIRNKISTAKKLAIELKKIDDLQKDLRESINKMRRNMTFAVEESLVVNDYTNQFFDYTILDYNKNTLSKNLSSSMAIAVSYLSELICCRVNEDASVIDFTSDIIQLSIIINSTIPCGVDYSVLASPLCRAHVSLLDNKSIQYTSMASKIGDIINRLYHT